MRQTFFSVVMLLSTALLPVGVTANAAGVNETIKDKNLTIVGYGNVATVQVQSGSLVKGQPIQISATSGLEVSPSKLDENSNGKITVRLVSSKAQMEGKVILRSGDVRKYIYVTGRNNALPVKDIAASAIYKKGNKDKFETSKFNPSTKGYTVEFKVKTDEGNEFMPYVVDAQGRGFKSYVTASSIGMYNSTSRTDGFANPSTSVNGGKGKFYNGDGFYHTYRFAVMPDNRAFVYRDGIAIDTLRLSDYGNQPDWATGNGKMTENLLKNPGFEGEYEMFGVKNAENVAKGIEGWNIAIRDYWNSQQQIVAEELDNVQDFNNHIAKLYPYAWAGGWGNGNINQVVDVAPGKTYTFSALAKGGIRKNDGSMAGTMFIEEMQDREKKASTKIASNDWEMYSLDFTTSPECKQVRVVFQVESGKWGEKRTQMEMDNVKLTGMSRKYTAKAGFENMGTQVEYFAIDTTGAYAPQQPVISVNF